jgi:hypothetical protein
MGDVTHIAKVYIADCPLGKGLFATQDLRAGEEVFVCTGRIITLDSVLAKGAHAPNPIQITKTEYIDVEAPGVFINHSCDPNAGLVENRIVMALRDILRGEEVCFDYSTSMSEQLWTMQCLCGSPRCRGVIGDFHLLPVELQVHYLAVGIVQEFIREECRELLPPAAWHKVEALRASLQVRRLDAAA